MIFVPWMGCWYLKSWLVGEGKTGAREGMCTKTRQSVGVRGVYVSIRSSSTTVSPNDSNTWRHKKYGLRPSTSRAFIGTCGTCKRVGRGRR